MVTSIFADQEIFTTQNVSGSHGRETTNLCRANVTDVVGSWRRIAHSRKRSAAAFVPCQQREPNAHIFPASARDRSVVL